MYTRIVFIPLFLALLNACGSNSDAGSGTGGTGGSSPIKLLAANDGVNGTEVWKTDASAAGTMLVQDINNTGDSSPSGFTEFQGAHYFSAVDGVNGVELWKSDGTAAGTSLVKDINSTGSSNPQNLMVLNGALYFSADDGQNGIELWKTDGTADGTKYKHFHYLERKFRAVRTYRF